MPSLMDGQTSLADMEAQLSTTTFKLNMFFDDDQEEEDPIFDPSSPFMPLDSGMPFVAKGHGVSSFDLAISKASTDDVCSGNDDPRGESLGRQSSPKVCIDRLYAMGFSLLDAEAEMRRQDAHDLVTRELSQRAELRRRLEAAKRAQLSAAHERERLERQRVFLHQSAEALRHMELELRGELAKHSVTRPRGAFPIPMPAKPLPPHPVMVTVGPPAHSPWPACPSLAPSGPRPFKTPVRRAPMVADYYWPQVVA